MSIFLYFDYNFFSCLQSIDNQVIRSNFFFYILIRVLSLRKCNLFFFLGPCITLLWSVTSKNKFFIALQFSIRSHQNYPENILKIFAFKNYFGVQQLCFCYDITVRLHTVYSVMMFHIYGRFQQSNANKSASFSKMQVVTPKSDHGRFRVTFLHVMLFANIFCSSLIQDWKSSLPQTPSQ